jgi:hypothetical protein
MCRKKKKIQQLEGMHLHLHHNTTLLDGAGKSREASPGLLGGERNANEERLRGNGAVTEAENPAENQCLGAWNAAQQDLG